MSSTFLRIPFSTRAASRPLGLKYVCSSISSPKYQKAELARNEVYPTYPSIIVMAGYTAGTKTWAHSPHRWHNRNMPGFNLMGYMKVSMIRWQSPSCKHMHAERLSGASMSRTWWVLFSLFRLAATLSSSDPNTVFNIGMCFSTHFVAIHFHSLAYHNPERTKWIRSDRTVYSTPLIERTRLYIRACYRTGIYM